MEGRTRMGKLVKTLALGLAIMLVGFLAGAGASYVASGASPALGGLWHAQGSQGYGEGDSFPSQIADDGSLIPYVASDADVSAWDATASPNYYRVAGKAVVGDMPAPGVVLYGELDALGRATGAVANVSFDSMQAGREREREDTAGMLPSGWGNNQEVDIAMPDGSVYHGQLFNRSHLVAKSLGGAEDLRNLITATRTHNVGANVDGAEGGMAYGEGLARSWLEAHPDGTVYYAATPVYRGDELLARSVLVDVRSSDGALDMRIEVYNAALGFDIDYATGSFVVTALAAELAQEVQEGLSAADTSTATAGNGIVPTGSAESDDGERKVIVTGSGKAYHHDETCRGLANARSMRWVSLSEAQAMGRHPCGICGG